MALKADRKIDKVSIETVYSKPRRRGCIFISNSGPRGLLLQDIVSYVNIPLWYEDHAWTNACGLATVTLMKLGWVVTDCIEKKLIDLSGKIAYATGDGTLTTKKSKFKVGKFMSNKDELGYAKVYIDV